MNSIRWGILGTGTIADLFAQALSTVEGAKIEAVAARTQDRANEFAARHRIPSALQGYDRLLQNPAIDVVYIATPNEHHREHCMMALDAGKAVLCEKPFALTAAEGKQVIALAESRRIFCMEAMWTRFVPAVREAMGLARDGKLGKLHFFSGQLGFPYREDPQNRLFRQPGGGALLDLGVYPLSLAQALFGSPLRTIAAAQICSTGVDEQFAAILTYRDGAQSQIAASLKAKLGNSASIHGAGAVVQLDEPLYFPERYHVTKTAPHGTGQPGSGRLAKLRRYPVVRNLANIRNRSKIQNVNRVTSRSGYSFEAEEAQRCLRAGLLESPEMPWKDTLAVLESMDCIRAAWSDTLPQ